MHERPVLNIVAHIFIMAAITAVLFTGCAKSPDELYLEGKELMQQHDSFENAVEVLVSFGEQYPDDPRMPEVLLALATGYQSHGRFDEATERYNQLIDTYADNDEAHKGMFLLGYMYYEDIGDSIRATELLTRFTERYPDSELAASARMLMENMGVPVEEWSVVRQLEESEQ